MRTTGAADSVEVRAAQGDRAAFALLVETTKAGLYRFVRRYVGDADDAFDVVQEAYAAAWFAMGRYDPSRPFDTWLRTIAVNKCRDWGRRRSVRRMVRGVISLDAPEAMAVGDDTPGQDAQLDDRRRLEALNRALARLPATLKAPLLLATLEARPHAEIAVILGITPKAVETRIARARRFLAARLEGPDAR
ncbi:RNA polymerase sigma factor [uncultured Brevundimonas sp.]|uniref:RNA polymerase sigma factor n=1 Tax=uncultured Brevundimonas sp. TaxID=213418 RepID=UPI0030EBF560